MNGIPIFIPVTRRNGRFKGEKLLINASMISMIRSLHDPYNNSNLKGCVIRIYNAIDIEVEEEAIDVQRMISSEIKAVHTGL